ncbi:hypothetical protein SteCoe_10522 [Stentor coeruleus]|uniref:Uncharacterized protein n=1 Tax=Stentor coeruleus TaxID=5963 RepID=A0A1R2CF85_9CILI|nr:hypothetical protein SteCoe_10522 [Stentor coeruleus]
MPKESQNKNSESLNKSQQFYKQLTRKISLVNKRMLNSEIFQDPIEKLEKEALRGCITDRGEAKAKIKTPKKPDMLTLILKSEHKITSNNCILKLPKMPFGKHNTYNENEHFVMRHFLNTELDLNKTQNEDLNEVTKKFHLHEKRKLSTKRNKTGYVKSRNLKPYDTYDMTHGDLKCKREEIILNAYHHDKEKYIKFIYGPQIEEKTPKSTVNKIQQHESVERLHNSIKKTNSELACFFTTKYPILFSHESSRRSERLKVPYLNLNMSAA